MPYAEVAVNAPTPQHQTFSYSVPPHLSVAEGQAVWVPFGPRTLQGIVFQLTLTPVFEPTRDIAGVVDAQPLLGAHQLALARWISDYYRSSLFEAASLMMPPGFTQRVLSLYQPLKDPPAAALSTLTTRQAEVYHALLRRGKMEAYQLHRGPGRPGIEPLLDQLARKGLVTKTTAVARPRVQPKKVRLLRLAPDPVQAEQTSNSVRIRRAPRQDGLLALLRGRSSPISLAEVRRLSFSSAVRPLLRRGLVEMVEETVQRDPLAHRTFVPSAWPTLTQAQEQACQEIRRVLHASGDGSGALDSGRPGQNSPVFLLHGVTGSGKTEVYLRALADVLSQGKQGVVLVPEIALTPQTVDRFASRFPGRVAVLHSGLSAGELYDEWWRIYGGEFSIVIGPRSAVFAPIPRPGLIILDEEHEWTYKQQETPPYYHSREVAIKLAELTGAAVILGSATPDVVSYHRGQRGEFRLLELPDRFPSGREVEDKGTAPGAAGALPEVELVDLRQELRQGNRSIFSRSLARAMTGVLALGEQAILFLNRRGAASFVQCRDCGHVLRCRRCDLALTYHSAQEELVCHLCNAHSAILRHCPHCKSLRIRFLGIGTQKVVEELSHDFPEARVLRWDRDATRGRRSHEVLLELFLAHEADILVGTQMIAKGLDLPRVTLVGVINADIGLHLPDFRAGERTFQLLTQVAGRAGRGPWGGKVIIQTYAPEHYAIAPAARHDYRGFYEMELSFRRQHGYPPFGRLARLLFSHPNDGHARQEALHLAQRLREAQELWGSPGTSLLGPVPPYTRRVRGRFRWQILLCAPHPQQLLARVAIPQGWAVDLDPLHLL